MMTDAKLDARCAKLLGYKPAGMGWKDPAANWVGVLSHYSTSLDACAELGEEIKRRGLTMEFGRELADALRRLGYGAISDFDRTFAPPRARAEAFVKVMEEANATDD